MRRDLPLLLILQLASGTEATAAATMPLLPPNHAAFVLPSPASRLGGSVGRLAAPPPFLLQSVAVNEGTVAVSRAFVPTADGATDEEVTETYSIGTRTFRPMSLSSRQAAPVLVLHGGPSVPSDYLYPLVDFIPYRSIVFFDQLGCGRSDEPKDAAAYSIEAAVDDVEAVVKKLGLRRFHLYGQSYGGILAFEYLKRVAERGGEGVRDDEGCLSVVLSSAPTSVEAVEASAERLLEDLRGEAGGDDGKDEDEDEDAGDSAALGERFRAAHICRTEVPPPPLLEAYAGAGTVWRGTDAIAGYVASPPSDGAARMPSALIVRGEHDFVDASSMEGWAEGCFNHKFVRERVLEGCAHHGLLENGPLYGEVMNDFFSQYD